MSRRRWLAGAIAAAALLLVLGRLLSAWYVERQWYAVLGAGDVWTARVSAVAALTLGSGAIAAAFLFLNLYAVRLSVVSLVLPRRVGNLDIGEEVPGRALLGVAALMSVTLGALLALSGEHWLAFLLARDGRAFGETDPYFKADLGFYVARLPFETVLYDWSLILLGTTAAVVILLYALTPSLRLGRGGLYVSSWVRRHLTMLAGVLLLLLAWSYRLDLFRLLLEGSGPGGAFGWVDHKVAMPGLLLLAIAALAFGIVVLWAGWIGQTRLAFSALTGVVILSLFVRHVVPAIVARVNDGAAPELRERPYLATRAAYTRRAFGVDRIVVADSSTGFASWAELARGTSLWDGAALVSALEEREQGSSDRLLAWTAGAAGLSAWIAQPTAAQGEPGSRWRLPRVAVTSGAADGRPRLLASVTGGGRLGAPAVYPGAAPYAVLPDSTGRVLGASLGGTTSRLAHAWALQNPRLADGGELPLVRPTLVLRRDVSARVEALAPFFTQGPVTPAVAGDTIFWIVHLYATSRHYPMAERLEVLGARQSYVRPAAVAVVHGATGRVSLLPARDDDPLAAGWIARFPRLFQGSPRELPASVIAAIPPLEAQLTAQAQALGRHGSRAQRPGARRVPLLDAHLLGGDDAVAGRVPPVSLDGVSTALVVPVLDEQARVAGLLIATGGARRRTLWRAVRIPGPAWDVALERLGSAQPADGVARGAVRALPMRDGVALVQSRYRLAPDGVPALAGVALLRGDSLKTGSSLATLAGVVPVQGALPGGVADGDAGRLWERMREALARGDWAAFGVAFDSLGTLLGRAPR